MSSKTVMWFCSALMCEVKMNYLKIAEVIKIEGFNKEDIAALLVPPKDLSLGDIALPCFRFAKALKKSPVQIAEELANSIEKPEMIAEINAVNGYLNFKYDKAAFAEKTLKSILAEGEKYGGSNEGEGKVICIDYSSINIAKPFHIGHLCTTVIGAALYRIFGKLGYKCVGINHLGDWGTQFGKLIVAYKKWGDKADIEKRGVRALLDIYVRFHKEAELDESLNDEARSWFKRIEDGDAEASQLFSFFKDITLIEVDKIYKRLNVAFDSYAGESFYNDKMQPVLDELEAKGLLSVSEGAKVVRFENDEMPPCLLVKADGASLYATRDIAAAIYRKNTYDFYKCLYVVAYQQNLHFKQFFKVVEMMGYEWAKDLEHIAFGMVSLEDGAMSTREGKVAFLDETLDKAAAKALEIINAKNPNLPNKNEVSEVIGVGAVVFGVLQSNRIKDIVFSIDKALNFDGETAPYVQYTAARAKSILEKCGDFAGEADYSCLSDDSSYAMVSLLAKFPEVVKDSAQKYEPSIIARYAVDVAQAFNKFYLDCRVNVEEQCVRAARLEITRAARIVLVEAMSLIGISCPEKM